MSTLRRAREHITNARAAVSGPLDRRKPLLAGTIVQLSGWNVAMHNGSTPEERDCARWLTGAGMLAKALLQLDQYSALTGGMPLDAYGIVHTYVAALATAEQHAHAWELNAIDDDDQPAPVTAHGRISGLERTATLLHACGCVGTLTLSGCSENTWREALRTNAAQDCTRCRVEKEQAALSADERTRRAMALWE